MVWHGNYTGYRKVRGILSSVGPRRRADSTRLQENLLMYGQYRIREVDEIAKELPIGSRTLEEVINHLDKTGREFVQFSRGPTRNHDVIIYRERI